MKKPEQNSSKPLVLEKEPQSHNESGHDSVLREHFQRFLELEKEGKAVNERKANLFAKAKENGYVNRALREAFFRHRVRELENPNKSKNHDELTDSYLIILRGTEDGDANSDSAPVCSAEETDPEPHASAHAHTGTREATTDGGGDDRDSEAPSGSSPAAEPAPKAHARARVRPMVMLAVPKSPGYHLLQLLEAHARAHAQTPTRETDDDARGSETHPCLQLLGSSRAHAQTPTREATTDGDDAACGFRNPTSIIRCGCTARANAHA
jgi:hypothetical protein